MRCFLPCFGTSSKNKKHLRPSNAPEPVVPQTQQNNVEETIHYIAQLNAEVTSPKEVVKNSEGSREEEQEKSAREDEIPHIAEKKEVHEEDHDVNNSLLQGECASESLFSISIDSKKQVPAENEVNSPIQGKAAREEKIPHIGEKKDEHKEDYEVNKRLFQEECTSESLFSLSIDSKKQVSLKNVEVNSPMQKLPGIMKVEYEAVVIKPKEQPNFIAIRMVKNSSEESSAKKLEENSEDKRKMYRYHDCCACDEGYDDANVDESDLDVIFGDEEKKGEVEEGAEEDVNRTLFQEESSESLFSLSIDSRKRISSAENVDNEVSSLIMPAAAQGTRIEHDDSSVLNPTENIITQQGKVAKATVRKMKDNKENINLVQDVVDIDHIPISPEPNLKLSSHKTREKFNNNKKQEIGVDTSLSSWLVEPERTPITMKSSDYSEGKHTPKEGRGSSVLSHEDRPILGALSIEEIRKYSSVSATSSRRYRSRSPDETPIIGTVGSYWSHTGQCTDSELDKHRKDTRLNFSSTIKTRLERAFEAEV